MLMHSRWNDLCSSFLHVLMEAQDYSLHKNFTIMYLCDNCRYVDSKSRTHYVCPPCYRPQDSYLSHTTKVNLEHNGKTSAFSVRQYPYP